MNIKIHFVDADPNILASFRRQLHSKYTLVTLENATEELNLITSERDFAAIISDYHMLGLNGIQFLIKIKEVSPDSTRIMLTGYVDMNTTLDYYRKNNSIGDVKNRISFDRAIIFGY